MRRTLAALAWIIWQVTWCLPQNAAGLVIWLAHCRARQFGFRYARVTAWQHRSCASMGCFIFMDERALRDRPLLVHEYGHTIQSAVLGWLYLPVIVLPSVLWFSLPALRRYRKKHRRSYYSFYTERWANHLGERVCREPSMGMALID